MKVRLELEAIESAAWRDGPPPDVRLRRLLKAALRRFGFRVTKATPVEESRLSWGEDP